MSTAAKTQNQNQNKQHNQTIYDHLASKSVQAQDYHYGQNVALSLGLFQSGVVTDSPETTDLLCSYADQNVSTIVKAVVGLKKEQQAGVDNSRVLRLQDCLAAFARVGEPTTPARR